MSAKSPGQTIEQALVRERTREQLAALRPGGSARWAIEVSSAAVIEPRAASMACPHCAGEYRIHEHTRPYAGIRRVDVVCRNCSTPRVLWFRIVEREPN